MLAQQKELTQVEGKAGTREGEARGGVYGGGLKEKTCLLLSFFLH